MKNFDLHKLDLNLLVVFDLLMQELNVSRTGERLGRTQSAISHALARLRQQVADPLLVKSGGSMRPTPRALALVEDVRPLLRQLGRLLTPVPPFEPRQSDRAFRIAAPDFMTPLFTRLLAHLAVEAPAVTVAWLPPGDSAFLDLAEGDLDVLLAPGRPRPPEGVAAEPVGLMQWGCYMRKGHPAARRWSAQAWQTWPHILVRTGSRSKSQVARDAEVLGLTRRIGLETAQFGAVAPLLADSNLIATLPDLALLDAAERHGLLRRPVPFAIQPLPQAMYWGQRQHSDAGNLWLRGHLRAIAGDLFHDDRHRRLRS